VASAPGGAYRGIIRVSGPEVLVCVAPIFFPDDGRCLEDCSVATVLAGRLHLDGWDPLIPCDLFVWPDERSYTRQPTVEIHTLGSAPVLEAIRRNLCRCGARPAEPGEFTMRAFLAGRLDLTQAEAVLGVIDATDRRHLDVALEQLAGGLATPLGTLRSDLLNLVAHLEAGLDFVEEDIEFISREALQTELREALLATTNLLNQMASRERSTQSVRVALMGSPNTGKSSLVNVLSENPVSLVSATPGTTRDYLTRCVVLDGLEFELIDTAGIGASAGLSEIEQQAQEVAERQRERCDLQVICIDSTRPLNSWERTELQTDPSGPRLVVMTKSDCPRGTEGIEGALWTSSKTGEGLAELRRKMVLLFTEDMHEDLPVVNDTATRCLENLRRARASLERAHQLAVHRHGEELVSAEIRLALDELGKVAGAVYTDDILDRVFSRFCIGK